LDEPVIAIVGLLIDSLLQTAADVVPIVIVIVAFQVLAFRSAPLD
jgi:hypothetical protein